MLIPSSACTSGTLYVCVHYLGPQLLLVLLRDWHQLRVPPVNLRRRKETVPEEIQTGVRSSPIREEDDEEEEGYEEEERRSAQNMPPAVAPAAWKPCAQRGTNPHRF